MYSTQLFNEYGAFLTPLAEEFNKAINPMLNSIRAFGRANVTDPQDWAFYRSMPSRGFWYDCHSGTPDGLDENVSNALLGLGNALGKVVDDFATSHPDLSSDDTDALFDYAEGCLHGIMAQVQIELSVEKRRALREARNGN